MDYNAVHQTFAGFGPGFSFILMNKKEGEIRQGKNHLLSAPLQVAQIFYLSTVIHKIAEYSSSSLVKTSTQVGCFVIPFLSIPFCLFSAAVKTDNYATFRDTLKIYEESLPHLDIRDYLKKPCISVLKFVNKRLPDQLSPRSVRVFSFFAVNTGKLSFVAMTVSSVALIALGNFYYGGTLLATLAYASADKSGLVSRRVSLFIERYMPAVSSVGLIVGGSVLGIMMGVLTLPAYTSSSFIKIFHQKVDLLFHRYTKKVHGPLLQEFDSSLKEKKDLTAKEINDILNINSVSSRWEINPSHCSKWAFDLKSMPSDHNFDKLIQHFDQFDWKSLYKVVFPKVRDDERFIAFVKDAQNDESIAETEISQNLMGYLLELAWKQNKLNPDFVALIKQQFPNESEENLKTNIKDFIKQATIDGKVIEQALSPFLADWVREQLVICVGTLKGEIPPKGQQADLDDAILFCSKLLHYMKSLDPDRDKVEMQDMLLKLAVEGGGYCPRGTKRASGEMLDNIFLANQQESDLDKVYEKKLRGVLQSKRNEGIQLIYEVICKQLKAPDAIKKDTHTFDVYRLALSLGFYPLTDNERFSVGFEHFACWEQFSPIRAEMLKSYKEKLHEAVTDIGEANFVDYLRQNLENNPNLDKTQREKILEFYSESPFSLKETTKRFHNLVFYMLGILRLKPGLN